MNRDNVIKLLGYGYFKTIVEKTSEATKIQCIPFYRNVALCEIDQVLGSKTIEVYNLNLELLEELENHFNAERSTMIPLMFEFGYSTNDKEKSFYDAVENAIAYIKKGEFDIKDCGKS